MGINVLSLFDGMSCGHIALDWNGIRIDKYFASEIKQSAIDVTKDNYPNTIHIGDVTKVSYKNGILTTENGNYKVGKIDLIIGGSPCQDFSFLKSSYTNNGNYGLEGEKSKLFHEFDRLRKETNATHFLLENVRMKKESEEQLNSYLGVKAIFINSELVSGQNRRRLYWTNIPGVTVPKDRNISLQNLFETNYNNLKECKVNDTPSRRKMWGGKCKNITHENKSSCLTTKMDRWNNGGLIEFENFCRFLTPIECERLQTVPEGYTKILTRNQRYDVLGDGWTVEVIAHIFSFIPKENVLMEKNNDFKIEPNYEKSYNILTETNKGLEKENKELKEIITRNDKSINIKNDCNTNFTKNLEDWFIMLNTSEYDNEDAGIVRDEIKEMLLKRYEKKLGTHFLKTKNNIRQQNVRKNTLGETNHLDTDSSRIVTEGHIPADSDSNNLKSKNNSQQCLNGEKPIEGEKLSRDRITPTRTTETPDKDSVDNSRTTPADVSYNLNSTSEVKNE